MKFILGAKSRALVNYFGTVKIFLNGINNNNFLNLTVELSHMQRYVSTMFHFFVVKDLLFFNCRQKLKLKLNSNLAPDNSIIFNNTDIYYSFSLFLSLSLLISLLSTVIAFNRVKLPRNVTIFLLLEIGLHALEHHLSQTTRREDEMREEICRKYCGKFLGQITCYVGNCSFPQLRFRRNDAAQKCLPEGIRETQSQSSFFRAINRPFFCLSAEER